MDHRDFTNLDVWKRSHQLMLDVYGLCKELPKDEKFITGDQIKRSSSSVSANVAEGYGRYYFQDNIAFCRKARGSLYETKNHLIKCKDLSFCDENECLKLIEECNSIGQLLNGYIRHLTNSKPGINNE
jgi:four helix bundle protein